MFVVRLQTVQQKHTLCVFVALLTIFIFILLIPATTNASTISRPLNNNGLVGYWNFNIQSGDGVTVPDKSGNENTGTLTNASGSSNWVSGKIGGGMEFDGVDDYVDLGTFDKLDGLSAFSISVWVFKESSGNFTVHRGIFARGPTLDRTPWIWGKQNTDILKMQFETVSGGVLSCDVASNSITTGVWTHIVALWDGSTCYMYQDGVEANSATTTGDVLIDTISGDSIGNIVGFNTWEGSLDEVRIYNRALSANEVKRLYNTTGPKLGKTPTIISDGLVGHWTFDGPDMSGTTAFDRSGQGNDGTLTNGPVRTIGKVGQALDFDGVNAYVDLGFSSTIGTGAFTFSAWYKGTDITSYVGVVGQGQGFTGSILENHLGKIRLFINNGVIDGISNISDGNWHFLTGTREGSVGKIYVDGVEENSTSTGSTASVDTGVNFWIAGWGNVTYVVEGSIDDARIYNRALSQDEITHLYNGTKPASFNKTQSGGSGLESGLVGHWTFDGPDMSGTTAFDRSGQGNDGTLTNGPVPTLGKIGQALDFDGADDIVNVPHDASIAPDGDITISVWVKPNVDWNTEPSAIWTLFDKTDNLTGYRVYITGYGGEAMIFTTGDGVSRDFGLSSGSLAWDSDRWYHLTFVFYDSPYDVAFYRDGALLNLDTEGTNTKMVQGTSVLRIGGGTDFGVDATLDDFRIYNRALSQDEITRLYNMGR